MSMGYCDGTCEYLEKDKRHTCAKYNEKLAWIRYRGAISCTAHEQCRQCQTDEWEQLKITRELQAYRDLGTVEELKADRKKQIPQKLDYEGDGYGDDGNIIYDTAICPICGKNFEVYYDDHSNYCPDCGQRLDRE